MSRRTGAPSSTGGVFVRPAPLMSVDPPAAQPGYVSKTDMVAALIRQLIITGELAAGGQLRQRDLAQRFGVSQTPVREALRRLESEGPLSCDTHRGFTVVVADLGRVAGYEYAHSPLLLSLMRLLWASLHGGARVSRTP